MCLLSSFSSEKEEKLTQEPGERGRSHARQVHLCQRLRLFPLKVKNTVLDSSQCPVSSPSNDVESFWKRGHRFQGFALRYLGDNGAAAGKEAELRGEPKGEVGETRRGLASRSPLCSFHSSSSFSIDRRLLTFDSFWRVCWSLACSVDSCLQGETESCDGRANYKLRLCLNTGSACLEVHILRLPKGLTKDVAVFLGFQRLADIINLTTS